MKAKEQPQQDLSGLTEKAAALEILRAIETRGYTALIVGGAVRDHEMALPMHDIDIATDMPMKEVRALFRAHDIGRSKEFGIYVVLHRNFSFEVAEFRGPTRFDGGGRPVGMATSATFLEDARRRDFTLNAMGMDSRGGLHDPWGGRADIRDRLVRGVQDPGARFDEDPLRLLRAVRFAARFDFALEPETEKALRARGSRIGAVAPGRVGDEFAKMAAQPGERFAEAIRWMDRVGLLEHVVPEVSALRGMPHDDRWHPEGDALEHTLAACAASTVRDPLVHLAVLLHDVGKPATYEWRRGRHSYLQHEQTGAEMAATVAKRLRYSAKWQQALQCAVRDHMKVHRLAGMRPSKIFRLVSADHWELVREVAYCDQAARGAGFDAQEFRRTVTEAETTARRWQEALSQPEGPKTVVTGHHLMALTGLPPGPKVGEMLREVTDWAIDSGVSDPAAIDAQILAMAGKIPDE